MLPGWLHADEARALARATLAENAARRELLEAVDLGRGERFYFDANLPPPLAAWREGWYRYLAPIANGWSEALGEAYRYPAEWSAFVERDRAEAPMRAQSYVSRLRAEDFLALHQCTSGERVFPLQVVALLSAPGEDFTGGEFVMTEQRPRMQSRPMVVPLGLGDAAIIATAQRPFHGANGVYRVNLKHAISRVREGERVGLEVGF
ncbi:2OG-Fe(II) oxygenase [Paraburkholderia acidisoli]|uniref:2OG-Fe(II) oxygenase n=1 Tax=Paraburkholderia acidisoli TaxID=2571748 RepID=UPI002D7E4BFF|nr:2OG-Fe(II) oxygenase [Paraburkholderia acidisoli]